MSCTDTTCYTVLCAVQVSYDWSKGAENHNPAVNKNYVLLHPVQVHPGYQAFKQEVPLTSTTLSMRALVLPMFRDVCMTSA